jgi:hypothetical protein
VGCLEVLCERLDAGAVCDVEGMELDFSKAAVGFQCFGLFELSILLERF